MKSGISVNRGDSGSQSTGYLAVSKGFQVWLISLQLPSPSFGAKFWPKYCCDCPFEQLPLPTWPRSWLPFWLGGSSALGSYCCVFWSSFICSHCSWVRFFPPLAIWSRLKGVSYFFLEPSGPMMYSSTPILLYWGWDSCCCWPLEASTCGFFKAWVMPLTLYVGAFFLGLI
jgi:hypothetical protein